MKNTPPLLLTLIFSLLIAPTTYAASGGDGDITISDSYDKEKAEAEAEAKAKAKAEAEAKAKEKAEGGKRHVTEKITQGQLDVIKNWGSY
jgi:membrane protein involved in colicin uptake